MEAEIYSKTNCGYCDRAKLRLAKYNPKIYMLDTDYTREDFFASPMRLNHKLEKWSFQMGKKYYYYQREDLLTSEMLLDIQVLL